MLERDKGPTKAYGFLVAIDIQDGVDLERVKFALGDAVGWMEGCGKSDIECLGPLDVYPEPIETVEVLENVVVNDDGTLSKKDVNG